LVRYPALAGLSIDGLCCLLEISTFPVWFLYYLDDLFGDTSWLGDWVDCSSDLPEAEA